jgi:hypothetical protein
VVSKDRKNHANHPVFGLWVQDIFHSLTEKFFGSISRKERRYSVGW